MVANLALKRNSLSMFWPCLVIFLILLFLRDYVGVGVSSFAFLILSLLIACGSDKSDVIAFCLCCIPMLNAFQSKYGLLICMLIYIIRFAQSLRINASVLPILLLIIWELLHHVDSNFSIIEIIRLFAELIFCCLLMNCDVNDLDFNRIMRSFAFTTTMICFIILFAQLKQCSFRVELLFTTNYRFGYGVNSDNLSVGFNPNILAFICLSAIEGLFMIIYRRQSKLIDIIMVLVLFVFGLLTMSRKFIICALLFFILYLFTQNKRSNKYKALLLLSILLLVIYFAVYTFFPSVINSIVARFSVDDISSGREDIFKFYNQQLSTNMSLLFFGVSFLKYKENLSYMFPNMNIPHNGIQELLVIWGIPGLILFSIFIISMICFARKLNKNIKFINYIPFIVYTAFIQAAQMVSSSVIVMLIGIAYICMTSDISNSERQYNL